jgi:DNA invertase Pin-like site-specific DNA recombinase
MIRRTLPPAPARAIAYLRVSTDRQADSGLGLEAQRASVTAAAARHGYELGGEFVDAGASGALALEDRPGLHAAIGELRRGDVLLVAKRDRLARSVMIMLLIEQQVVRRRARILSAAGEGTETGDPTDPTARLTRGMLDLVGEFERGIIAARTRAALAAKKARGERAGTVPFGYGLGADGQRLVPRADEQDILRLVRELHDAGHSLRAIADELNRRGYRARSGAAWRHQYVAKQLRRLAAAAAA